ncbi:MAG: haloacid dehalogenase-like hydrolase [Peptostreptococcaceae bacterium]
MTKRLLDFDGSDFLNVSPLGLKEAILLSEGRVVLAENVPTKNVFLSGVTNAEIERAAGADLILFNGLDILNPHICGAPKEIAPQEHISWVKRAISRCIGINLEPIDCENENSAYKTEIGIGRIASPITFKKAQELGFDFVCLTGNPNTGVTNKAIIESIRNCKKYFNGIVISGKMHSAGIDEEVMNLDIAKQFIDAGTDILLVPAPYTVPFFTEENFLEITKMVRGYNKDVDISKKVLIMSSIGTSQDSSDKFTIKRIALSSKMCGADIQHIGDSFNGIALPENIYALGEAIRGRRHQLTIMAKSNIR